MESNVLATASSPLNKLVVSSPSPIHGQGAFAANHIPAHTRVIEYLGEKN